MELKSLGYQSDLIFNRFDGEVIDRGDYLVVKSLTNPNYYWGNLLIFEKEPQKGDFLKWTNTFKKEFKDPRIYHMTFAWDSKNEGDTSEFTQKEFRFEKNLVLSTNSVTKTAKYNPEISVRPIQSHKDWDRVLQIQMACAHSNHTQHEWQKFYTQQMKRYQHMIHEDRGKWFGAFIGDNLVGSLGVFTEGPLGRFQIVSTHPDFQKQGVCSTLVYESAEYAFQNMNVKTLVMHADPDYHAARVYESVGFKPTETIMGLCWWNKERASV